ncbi:DUF4089 domain-containing protein [Acetobacter sp. TBRC 12305]|uniref:DUF4089 domain-containing protein n=2 Tax=Acetobacter garciniae TaxID=2817435 RepID=A0A939KQI6_9PROT|nr:DUF4089 domain-containing protein [Acetobacter garciniae]MBX0345379.1 DUF4089 domain-containing protein [Acetobacter garciniae]
MPANILPAEAVPKDATLALVQARAAALGLVLPEACLPGIVSNTDLLGHYTALLEQVALPDLCEPAGEYTP